MTMDDATHTDGNAVAGLLGELLPTDPTMMLRRCASCGDTRALGEHRAYHGAGVVLRCPRCEDVAIVIGVQGDARTVLWRGTFLITAVAAAPVA
jgi:hypothetical protein